MLTDSFKTQIEELKSKQLITEALQEILNQFNLNHPAFKGFYFREELNSKGLLLTAEGTKENGISIHVPQNILDFDLALVTNLIMHEIYHIHQRTGDEIITEREEREWQAYYEMIFHEKFPQIPQLSSFYHLQFGKKALNYYKTMHLDLKEKYALQKIKLEHLIETIENKQD